MIKWIGEYVHQSWLVVMMCGGVVAGVILGLVFRVNYFVSVWWIVCAGLLLVVAYLRPRVAFVIIAGIAGMVVAFFRVSSELAGQDYIRGLNGETVVVAGIVDGDPETDEKGTKLKLKDLKFGKEQVESVGRIYVTLGQNEEMAREDRVVLSGKMLDGFGTYAGYLYRPKVVKWERPEPGSWVLALRNWFAGRIRGLIPEPQVSLGLSYLLGMKAGLPKELSEQLRVVGLVHIVVASGAHLSILVEVARKVFGKMSRLVGVVFAVVFVVFFMAMVGWTPSILRAGIMAIMTLAMWYVGRKMAPWRLILMVAALTLMMEPNYVIDLGWLLSFASFGGIMMLGPGLVRFFYGQRKPGFVASMVLTTVSATLMTLPIVLYYYGTVSLISVVANLLILPTLSWTMGLVFLTGVCAGIPGVEVVVGWCATRMLDFHMMVVGWFGEMRQFLIEIPPYQGWVWWLYGVLVLVVLGNVMRRVLRRRK